MIVEAEAVRVRYRGGALGVDNVSLAVGEGQVVALFGANGAGKTTMARAISGFLKTEGTKVSGEIRLFGRDTTHWEPHRIAALGVSSVPERHKVFPALTVRENLLAVGTLPPRSERAKVLEEIYSLFPVVKDRRDEQAGRLSGGEQQMLALARSLISQPRLLVVDEMTLGLHHSMQPPLFDTVRRVAQKGTSVLLIDEATGFALEVADYCYLLRAGTIVAEGPAEQFRGNELLAAGYVGGD